MSNAHTPISTYVDIVPPYLKVIEKIHDLTSKCPEEASEFVTSLFEGLSDYTNYYLETGTGEEREFFFKIETWFQTHISKCKSILLIMNPTLTLDKKLISDLLGLFHELDRIEYVGLL